MELLPRYFHPAIGAAPADDVPPDAVLVHVVDAFVLGEREWVVGVDASGRLCVAPGEDRHRLHPVAQAELSHAEVSGAARRRIEAKELFLLDLQLVEQPADEPGPNDPVYLYGTLLGPLPLAPGLSLPAQHGQLATTRADVLDALVSAATWSFRYAATFGGSPTHCSHLMLAGDREDAIAHGNGLILAYPMMPPEVAVESPANEAMANQVLKDVLGALLDDLREKPKGFWGKVFGQDDALKMPEKGAYSQHLAIAEQALKLVPGWPTPRASAVRTRVSKAVVSASPRPVVPVSAPPPIRTPQPVKPREDGPAAWMRDFMDAHHKPGAKAPRVTIARSPASKPAPAADWRSDFAPAEPSRAPEKEAPKTQEKPDWMKDFER